MKNKLLLVAIAFLMATTLALLNANPGHSIKKYNPARTFKPVVRCSPDWTALHDWLEESDIPPIPGAGSWKWKISTPNDSAQFYFNQGMNMYYSFHIIESMASFKKAARFDPGAAMLHWAQALAYGPNINDLGYTASPEALEATEKARELSAGCTPMEKSLIDAMVVRYSRDSANSRSMLNQAYTDKMKAVYEKYSSQGDVAALYADAMMLQHPWDLWHTNGTPQTWTPLIRSVLEKTLAQHPGHPGSNHYYIHVMEASPFAAKAIPAANRLGKITPGLSHTVHMPSHIYLRTGNYQAGIDVNEAAVKSYEKSIPLFAPVTGADFLYIIHNLHMQTNQAMLSGESSLAAASAQATVKSIKEDYLSIPGAMGNLVQYVYMTPVFVDVRYGNWDNLLNTPAPASNLIYANVIWHFGRGMAFSEHKNYEDAIRELKQLQVLIKDSSLYAPFPPFSSSIEGAKVAEQLLTGKIALVQKLYAQAIEAFGKAVTIEENMVYDEPRDWLLTPRHYLADALLKSGDPKKAFDVLKIDLARNNKNGWALFGSWQALTAMKQPVQAAAMLKQFHQAFKKSDVKLYGPVF